MSACEQSLPLLMDGARELGISLSARALERYVSYCAFLLDRNQRLNLTAIRSEDGVMRTLFLDSLTLLVALPRDWSTRRLRVVDVGAGGGFPGIPVKIACDSWDLTLIESIGKKARFLEEVGRHLNMRNVTVLPERAEEAGRRIEQRDSADLCTARAVGRLSTLLELCSPFVRTGGLLLFPKSGEIGEEIDEAQVAAETLRLRRRPNTPVPTRLGLGEGRVIVVYEKTGPTPPQFPRRTGLARSSPIV
jgi:16S rRNA (guanine527-N7)-methyltransferase